jgi:hypothetical protein
MGAYHGKLSFDIFFIKKAIVKEELAAYKDKLTTIQKY